MGSERPRGGQKAKDRAEIQRLQLENIQLMDELIAAKRALMELQQIQATKPSSDSSRDSLPALIEGEIQAQWGTNPVAAQLSRSIALARLRSNVPKERIAETIRLNGEKVD